MTCTAENEAGIANADFALEVHSRPRFKDLVTEIKARQFYSYSIEMLIFRWSKASELDSNAKQKAIPLQRSGKSFY